MDNKALFETLEVASELYPMAQVSSEISRSSEQYRNLRERFAQNWLILLHKKGLLTLEERIATTLVSYGCVYEVIRAKQLGL